MTDADDTFDVLAVNPTELLRALNEANHPTPLDPFRDLTGGDAARARRTLLFLGRSPERLSPFITEDGLTLLHLAARFDLRQATATLLAWGVPVDAMAWPHHRPVGEVTRSVGDGLPLDITGEQKRGAFGLTPLHLAVLANHEAMVRYLLSRGANPRRVVGLDGGVEGTWRWTTSALARAVAQAGADSSAIQALLSAAEPTAEEPPENRWIPNG